LYFVVFVGFLALLFVLYAFFRRLFGNIVSYIQRKYRWQ
jgi:hypothetical protein